MESRSLAKAAGVSKTYLYSRSDLRERIEAIRQQELEQAAREYTSPPVAGRTDRSRDLIILAKDRRIKELEAENRKLQQQLKAALGKAYDQMESPVCWGPHIFTTTALGNVELLKRRLL